MTDTKTLEAEDAITRLQDHAAIERTYAQQAREATKHLPQDNVSIHDHVGASDNDAGHIQSDVEVMPHSMSTVTSAELQPLISDGFSRKHDTCASKVEMESNPVPSNQKVANAAEAVALSEVVDESTSTFTSTRIDIAQSPSSDLSEQRAQVASHSEFIEGTPQASVGSCHVATPKVLNLGGPMADTHIQPSSSSPVRRRPESARPANKRQPRGKRHEADGTSDLAEHGVYGSVTLQSITPIDGDTLDLKSNHQGNHVDDGRALPALFEHKRRPRTSSAKKSRHGSESGVHPGGQREAWVFKKHLCTCS